jgi:hypothetical protein
MFLGHTRIYNTNQKRSVSFNKYTARMFSKLHRPCVSALPRRWLEEMFSF